MLKKIKKKKLKKKKTENKKFEEIILTKNETLNYNNLFHYNL
jgi:hypothetical protein